MVSFSEGLDPVAVCTAHITFRDLGEYPLPRTTEGKLGDVPCLTSLVAVVEIKRLRRSAVSAVSTPPLQLDSVDPGAALCPTLLAPGSALWTVLVLSVLGEFLGIGLHE